jgi:hypothetical protein
MRADLAAGAEVEAVACNAAERGGDFRFLLMKSFRVLPRRHQSGHRNRQAAELGAFGVGESDRYAIHFHQLKTSLRLARRVDQRDDPLGKACPAALACSLNGTISAIRPFLHLAAC